MDIKIEHTGHQQLLDGTKNIIVKNLFFSYFNEPYNLLAFGKEIEPLISVGKLAHCSNNGIQFLGLGAQLSHSVNYLCKRRDPDSSEPRISSILHIITPYTSPVYLSNPLVINFKECFKLERKLHYYSFLKGPITEIQTRKKHNFSAKKITILILVIFLGFIVYTNGLFSI